MQYNILTGALWEINTDEGNTKDIPFDSIYNLVDYTAVPVIDITEVDTVVLDFDFGYRVHLDRFEYKFTTLDATSSAVASGIEFFYKDDSFEDYISLATYVTSSGIFHTTVSGSTFAPRFIRFKHSPINTYGTTVVSGSMYGFKAVNNDTIVDFGENAEKEEENLEVVRGDDPDIRTVSIYNSGSTIADAYINIEPAFSDFDEVVSISKNIDGPWTKSVDAGNLLVGFNNFDMGEYSNTEESESGYLTIKRYFTIDGEFAVSYDNAIYTTPILSGRDAKYSIFILTKKLNVGGYMRVENTDSTDTIQIRSNNVFPKPYAFIRELKGYAISNYYYVGYIDRWLDGLNVKEDTSIEGTWYMHSFGRYEVLDNYAVYFDGVTERWAGFFSSIERHRYGYFRLHVFNNGVGKDDMNTKLLAYDTLTPVSFSWIDTRIDSLGGIWVYFFCQSYNSSDFVDNTGYYLVHFDTELNDTFKWYTVEKEIMSMNVDYDDTYIWYTRPTTNSIYKIGTAGNVSVNFSDYEHTIDLGGLAVFPSGDIIYANGSDLHRLSSTGEYLGDYLIENAAIGRINAIELDGDGSEAIWTIDGLGVGRLYISGDKIGTYDFMVEDVEPVSISAVEDGVWARCIDLDEGIVKMRFISRENRRVDVDFRPDFLDSSSGLFYQTMSHKNYIEKMPIETDSVWSNDLEFRKISLENYLSPEDNYYQLKLRLVRQSPIDRYPEFVTDPAQEYFNNDDFVQTSATPKELLWGDWKGKPNLDRVYVNTVSGCVTLTPLIGGIFEDSAYINTRQRFSLSWDDDGYIDCRVKYKVGDGNGIETDTKNIYFYAYGMQENHEDNSFNAFLTINSSAYSYLRIYIDGIHKTNIHWYKVDYMYEGEIRLFFDISNSSFKVGWRPITGGSWRDTPSYGGADVSKGNIFYFSIKSDRDGPETYITNFETNLGTSYYCSDSPEISGLYNQELLCLENIYPNTYKDIYLKTYVARDLNVGSNQDMSIKTRWRAPVH